MTYVQPTKPSRPFKRGDLVDAMDREGNRMSTVRVVRAGKRIVRTSCGRTWSQRGWWIGEQEWPFPWIRHSRRKDVDHALKTAEIHQQLRAALRRTEEIATGTDREAHARALGYLEQAVVQVCDQIEASRPRPEKIRQAAGGVS